MSKLQFLGLVLFLLFPSALTTSALAGPDTAGTAIAFANVSSGSSIASFGGKGTTSASGDHVDTGIYDVTFNGKYPKNIVPASVIINATPESVEGKS